MYSDNYRNTLLVDVLEYFRLVKPSHNFAPQATQASLDQESSNKSTKEADIEKDLESGSGAGSAAASATGENRTDGEAAASDPFLVDWNGPSDPENPHNWSRSKKGFVVVQIMILTCVTYMGASIYTPGQEYIQQEFGVGHVVGTLNLSLYVLGYGLGPMVFSPLSETARFGRQHIYLVTLFLFMIFQVGAATVHNIGGLVVIRFISGVLCSPALATGAGSMGDFISPELVPIFIGMWAVGAVAAPVLAPLLGAAMTVAENWRWIFWLLMWLAAATFLLLAAFFPETYASNILHRRAARIRRETGDNRYYTKQERAESEIKTKDFISEILYRPFEIIFKEPIVLAFDIYIALCYGAFYLFFEAFPIVFVGIYNFTLIELGLAFLGFCVGCVIAYIAFLTFLAKVIMPKFKNNTFTPESFLLLAMSVCWSLPLSLFLFGWAAGVHWILPMIAEIFFVLCVFNLFQATFAYLAICYPRYMASVFAGNGFCRAVFACAFPLFGRAMYENLGSEKYPVGWGSSLVGFFSIALAAIPFIFNKYGSQLRGRSSYAN
ncbi:MFS transporter [Lachancea thermotolerans CBS 6340]|uniref:KLTH0H09856p n=1 Tax=Lachancea thermotolerans (strain ATCC 56472 / CBS 6340 / NRRL Y-8284) TaxID=559295 RepID=C5E331_LACTC|nr:KLTH0H09856p [Lachancea thermotolerans CBS 6340]CAR30442.1 KLTH0H09856p [Lachancea thermotolerans CBS 6340]